MLKGERPVTFTKLMISAAALAVAAGLAAPALAQDKLDIAFIPGVGGDAYYGSVQCGIEKAAAEAGATVQTQAPSSFDPATQIPILETMIAQNPDAIVIAPTDSQALFAPLKRAVDQGIKVVLVDTTLADPSIAVSEVSSDNIEAGRVAAQKLAEILGDKKGSVLTVNLSAGVTTTDDREKGFAEGIQAAGFKYLGQEFSDNSVQKADQIVSAALLANPDLVGVFSTAAFNTEGAVAAIRAAGKSDDVQVVGFNANPPGIEQLERKQVAAQVVLKPYDEGYEAGKQAIAALKGEPITAKILTGATVATPDNLKDADVAKYVYSFTCPQ